MKLMDPSNLKVFLIVVLYAYDAWLQTLKDELKKLRNYKSVNKNVRKWNIFNNNMCVLLKNELLSR